MTCCCLAPVLLALRVARAVARSSLPDQADPPRRARSRRAAARRSSRAPWRRRWRRHSASRSSSTTSAAARGNVAMQEVAQRRPRRLHADHRPRRHAGGESRTCSTSCPTTWTRTSRRSRCSPWCPPSSWCTPTCRRRTSRSSSRWPRRSPGKLNYGSAGNGSAGHLAMEYLKHGRPASTSSTCPTRAPARSSSTWSPAARRPLRPARRR